jgi:energy-coupling factor transporter ATP-binding protein EcfA2
MSTSPKRQTPPIGPFAHLNLTRNPFGEFNRAMRVDAALVDIDALVECVEEGRAVQLVGDSGRGKTTHLYALDQRLEPETYIHVKEEGPQPDIPASGLLLIDEIQFLESKRRWQAYNRQRGPVVATHVDVADEMRAAGRDPVTVDLNATDPDLDTLAEMCRRRIDVVARGDGPVPEISREALIRLGDRFGGNLRAIEHTLYEIFQSLDGPRSVGIDDIRAAPDPAAAVLETTRTYTLRD